MADNVVHLTELMVPELQDLEKRGFFSRSELKQVARKRTDFEYLLKRRATLREDFLRYIAYEKQVEALRVARKKSRRLQGKATLSDHAGKRRIHFIFERASRKFPSDLRIWTMWLSYCRETKSMKRVSTVLAKALQFHPTSAGLWSHAAAWEMQHHGNATAARVLMQRGLRLAKDNESLWLDYFKLELTFVQRLHSRRKVLGSPASDGNAMSSPVSEAGGEPAVSALGAGSDGEAGSDKEAVLSGDETTEVLGSDSSVDTVEQATSLADVTAQYDTGNAAEGDTELNTVNTVSTVSTVSMVSPENVTLASNGVQTRDCTVGEAADDPAAVAMQAILSGAIAGVVFRSAIEAVPQDLRFRTQFLAALQPFRFQGVKDLEATIYRSIASDFGSQPEAVDLAARRHVADSVTAENLMAAVAVYEEALQGDATAALFSLFHTFLEEQLERLLAVAAHKNAPDGAGKAALEWAHRLLAAYSAASVAGLASEAAYLAWPPLAARCGRDDETMHAATAGCTAMPTAVPLQCQLLSILADGLTQQCAANPKSVAATKSRRQLKRHVITALHQAGSNCGSGQLWSAALSTAHLAELPVSDIAEALVSACLIIGKQPMQGGLGEPAAAILTAVRHSDGLIAARQLWKRLAAGPGPGGRLLRAALSMEVEALEAGESHADVTAAVAAAEAGVRSYGSEDADLWLQYTELAKIGHSHGGAPHSAGSGVPTVADVIWRAQKSLAAPEQYAQLVKEM